MDGGGGMGGATGLRGEGRGRTSKVWRLSPQIRPRRGENSSTGYVIICPARPRSCLDSSPNNNSLKDTTAASGWRLKGRKAFIIAPWNTSSSSPFTARFAFDTNGRFLRSNNLKRLCVGVPFVLPVLLNDILLFYKHIHRFHT